MPIIACMGSAVYQNGVRIRLMRVERGTSAKDFAERLGIGRRHLYNIERGRNAASIGTLIKIAEAFGVPLDDLILRDDTRAAA